MPLESGHFCQNSIDHRICVSTYISKYFRRNISNQIGLRRKFRMIRDDFFSLSARWNFEEIQKKNR